MKLSPSLRAQLPRLITGLALASVLAVCLWLDDKRFLTAALALVGVLALFEFMQLVWPGKDRVPTKIIGILLGLALFCPLDNSLSPGAILGLAAVWSGLAFLWAYGRGKQVRLEQYAPLAFGLLYICLTLRLALDLTLREQLIVIVSAMVSDTAAYYTGNMIGRHKVWPSVSPNKSWEGCAAGFLFGVGAVVGVSFIPFAEQGLVVSWPFWIAIGAALNLAAQFGDFFESALKRSCNTKDSGAILPGHGGVLDRIDSLLFALAAYCAIKLGHAHFVALAAHFTFA